jgi:hypothetical protein
MVTFEPPEVKDDFIKAIKVLYDFKEIELEDCVGWHEDTFKFEDLTDDTIITRDSVFSFYAGADDHPEFTVAELIALADELPRSKVVDLLYYVSPSRVYVRVDAKNEAAYQLVNHIMMYGTPSDRRFETTYGDVTVALVNGFTPFAIHLMVDGEYESDTYPTYHDNDLFVEVLYPVGTHENVWRPLVPAYLFELHEQTGLALSQEPRGAYAELWPEEYDQEAYFQKLDSIRLRPLMGGAGCGSGLSTYR